MYIVGVIKNNSTVILILTTEYTLKGIDMIDSEKVKKEMEAHQTRIDMCASEVRKHINDYGNDNCEYLIHRRLMEQYHRGAYNALLSISEKLS